MKVLEVLGNEFKNQPLSFLAAAITIINIFGSIPALVTSDVHIVQFKLDINIVIRAFAFIALEGALAYAFGKLFVVISYRGAGLGFLFMLNATLASAWVSGFNCYWLFAIYGNEFSFSLLILIAVMFLAYMLNLYYVSHHFEVDESLIQVPAYEDANDQKYKLRKLSNTRGFHSAWMLLTFGFIFVGIHFGTNLYERYTLLSILG
ncbi:hypothetical protein [Curvivirga sp.]|uniref:hypothetical protein n=1 Tax=Curvivirga sp. TaxID=2856848 RepID=UPI003B597912